MTLAGVLKMAQAEVLAQRGRSVASALGIALGITVLLVILGLGLGVRETVLQEVVQELPLDMVEVVPKTMDLGLFKIGAGGLFGGGKLDAETLEKLASLPEVQAAYPKLEVKLPLGAQGGGALFRRRLYTDIFLTGLPEALVQPKVGAAFTSESDVVPVVINDQLIEIYNSSVAKTLGTPELTEQTLIGFEFDLVIGRSMMLGSRGAKRDGIERGRIVGVSPYALRLGASVPLETARRLMREYGTGDEAEAYQSILLKARSASDVPAVREAAEALGFSVDETAKRTSDLLSLATLLASLVGLLVLALASLNIAHSFFALLSERRRELAVMRAVGARRLDLVLLVLTQAAMLGVLGGVLGIAFARAFAALLDWILNTFAPTFPFKPESLFYFTPSLYVGALVLAILAAVLGALWPAVRASRSRVARVLAEL